jgi:hypothetical protein
MCHTYSYNKVYDRRSGFVGGDFVGLWRSRHVGRRHDKEVLRDYEAMLADTRPGRNSKVVAACRERCGCKAGSFRGGEIQVT